MKSKLVFGQKGDTIVEVLISVAIVSLVLAISYATANHNVRSIQDAQERSQAFQLAQGQVEYLRIDQAVGGPNSFAVGSSDCFDKNGNPASGDNCIVTSDNNPVGDTLVQPQYHLAITRPGQSFIVNIKWDSLLNSETQDNLTIYYRP